MFTAHNIVLTIDIVTLDLNSHSSVDSSRHLAAWLTFICYLKQVFEQKIDYNSGLHRRRVPDACSWGWTFCGQPISCHSTLPLTDLCSHDNEIRHGNVSQLWVVSNADCTWYGNKTRSHLIVFTNTNYANGEETIVHRQYDIHSIQQQTKQKKMKCS